MLATLIVSTVLTTTSMAAPHDGSVYELCSLTLNDGTTIGTTQQPCADASPKNGIRIEGTVYQSCSRHHGSLCFTYENKKDTILYTIHLG